MKRLFFLHLLHCSSKALSALFLSTGHVCVRMEEVDFAGLPTWMGRLGRQGQTHIWAGLTETPARTYVRGYIARVYLLLLLNEQLCCCVVPPPPPLLLLLRSVSFQQLAEGGKILVLLLFHYYTRSVPLVPNQRTRRGLHSPSVWKRGEKSPTLRRITCRSVGAAKKRNGTSALLLALCIYVVQTHMLFTIIVAASPSLLQFFPFIVDVCLPSLLYRTGHMLPLLLLLLLPILNQPSLGIERRPWRRRSPSSSSFPFNLGVPEETFSPLSLRSMRRDAAARPMKWGRRGKSWI